MAAQDQNHDSGSLRCLRTIARATREMGLQLQLDFALS